MIALSCDPVEDHLSWSKVRQQALQPTYMTSGSLKRGFQIRLSAHIRQVFLAVVGVGILNEMSIYLRNRLDS